MKIIVLSRKIVETYEKSKKLDIPNITYNKPTNSMTPPRELKMVIFERDNRKCQICNKPLALSQIRRNAPIFHHLNKISYCGPGDHSPNNLLTICCSCHADITCGRTLLKKESD